MQFGQTSVISNNGVFISVGTAANNNAYYNLAYMYKKDVVTGRFRWGVCICFGGFFDFFAQVCIQLASLCGQRRTSRRLR